MERYKLFKKQSDSDATTNGGILVWDEEGSVYLASSIPLLESLQHKYFADFEKNGEGLTELVSLEEIRIGPALDVAPYVYRLKSK